jgi:hypothetical protein
VRDDLAPVDPFAYQTNLLRVASTEEAKALAAEEERKARKSWAIRFRGARSRIPPRFSWVEPLRPARIVAGRAVFVVPDLWRDRLPWLHPDALSRLWDAWESRTNLLLCGDVDLGKTALLVLHAQWTFALASFDAKEITAARNQVATWRPANRLDAPPREPEWLPQVREAQYLRFMSATELLDDKLQGPNETKLREAITSTALYLDDVGREMGGAKGSGHVASSRRAAVMRVLEARWSSERRFVATTEHTTDELAEMYGAGSFRRIAGERSGATVIDLSDEQWAGPWLRQQKAKTK